VVRTLAEALITMIWMLAMINDVDLQLQRDRYLREADQFSARAVTLDEGNPRAWLSRAHALHGLGRWNASLEASDRALKLDPYDARSYLVRAQLMTGMGRPAEALPQIERALEFATPADLGPTLSEQCEADLLLGDADKAIASCERASGLVPNAHFLHSFLAAAYANAGDMTHANAALKALLKTVPGSTIAQLRASRHSDHPEYQKLAEQYWYDGLRKAGLPEE
jgi:tetratricopeptide (TPR) repeat protein